MNTREIGKSLGIRHNVSFRVIDVTTGKVVATHVGHNAATNSLLTGIGHYLKGDGVLNQGWHMLSQYVPKYISLGTMGLLHQEQDDKGLPTGLGEKSYAGLTYGYLSDEQLAGIHKKFREIPDPSPLPDVVEGDPDVDVTAHVPLEEVDPSEPISEADQEYLRYIDYLAKAPGFGADGYDPNQNNGRAFDGLGPMYEKRVSQVTGEGRSIPAYNVAGDYSWTQRMQLAVVGDKCTLCGHEWPGSKVNCNVVFDLKLTVPQGDTRSTYGTFQMWVYGMPTNMDKAHALKLQGQYSCKSAGDEFYIQLQPTKQSDKIDESWGVYDEAENIWWRYSADKRCGPMVFYPVGTINCELISNTFPRAAISFRDVVPEIEAEFPKTIDVIFSAMISTGALAQFREPGKDYVFITEAGLWATKDWTAGGDNGLLAGYRMAPTDKKYWELVPYDDLTEEDSRKNIDRLRSSVLRVGKNQVVQVIWKIQLGSIDQFEGIEALYPPENKLQWTPW